MTHPIIESIVGDVSQGAKRFFVHSLLPTLNEYTKASRGNKYASAGMKRKAEEFIMWEIRSQLKNWTTERPVFLLFRWVERDMRRDHDNVAFAKKFVQDALVKSGVIRGDGWKHVTGFVDLFAVDKKNPGVEVYILEVCDDQERTKAVRRP